MRSRIRDMNNSGETAAKKLLEMKDAIEEATGKVNVLKGKLESAEDQLATEFNCKSLSMGKSKLAKLDDEIETKEEALEEGVERLKEGYEWN